MALQIGHRISFDFDLFSEEEIPKSLLAKVKRTFAGHSVVVSVNNPDELTIFVDGTKITFLYYPFPRIFELSECEGVALLSVKEIAATKAYTVGRRGSYKDYIDLYFIISEGRSSIREIIEISQNKYKDEFNARLFLEQLIYLEDTDDVDIQFLTKNVTKKELRAFFEQKIAEFGL